MENATKALLMAAVILISVIILSLGVYLFMYFSDYAKGVNDDIRTNQIAQFNSQFLSYQRKELTVYDVITLANMAKDYNKENEYYNDTIRGYIGINANIIDSSIGSTPPPEGQQIGGSPNDVSKIDPDKIGEYITDEKGNEIYKLKTYHCTVTIDNDVTKMVNNIKITQ